MNAHNEQQSIIAGALFDLMGYLTCREKKLHLSASDDAAPAVEALTEWAEERGFDLDEARVTDWQAALAAQPSPVVKQNLTTQPAAAQEAVAEVVDIIGRSGVEIHWLGGPAEIGDLLYAAPVTAAPADLIERCREILAWQRTGVLQGDALRAYANARWPDEHDPLQIAEKETAREAFRILAMYTAASTPAAPGIDLEQFREAVTYWRDSALRDMKYQNGPLHEQVVEAQRLLALIDASPGAAVTGIDLTPFRLLVEACEAEFTGPETEELEPDDSKVSYPEDRCHITFGMIRNARKALATSPKGTTLNEQFGSAEGLDSPKGGSEAQPMFYIQDTRSFVGNCPMWWGPEGRGYVTRLDEAGRYTEEEAIRQNRARDTDIPWPCDEIDKLARPTVDCQHMRPRSERLAELAAQASDAEVRP